MADPRQDETNFDKEIIPLVIETLCKMEARRRELEAAMKMLDEGAVILNQTYKSMVDSYKQHVNDFGHSLDLTMESIRELVPEDSREEVEKEINARVAMMNILPKESCENLDLDAEKMEGSSGTDDQESSDKASSEETPIPLEHSETSTEDKERILGSTNDSEKGNPVDSTGDIDSTTIEGLRKNYLRCFPCMVKDIRN